MANYSLLIFKEIVLSEFSQKDSTVYSRYLEFQGTEQNVSSYQ